MKISNQLFKSILAAVFVAMFTFQGAAFAGNACNGLKSKECAANKDCTWVKGYEKKDGTKVKGHCKAAGKAKEKKAK